MLYGTGIATITMLSLLGHAGPTGKTSKWRVETHFFPAWLLCTAPWETETQKIVFN
jgi:hypothetical protein